MKTSRWIIVSICMFVLGIAVGEIMIEYIGMNFLLTPYGEVGVGVPKMLDNFNQTNYTIESFTLSLAPASMIKNISGRDLEWGEQILGVTFPEDRVIYVSMTDFKDINGYNVPNLCNLGHEVWHLSELGERWHA